MAESSGLYERLRGMIGWTFTFVLQAPEPAIVKPNIELYDYSGFRLYLVNARSPDGRLLTTRETLALLPWDHVPLENVEIDDIRTLRKLVEAWSADIYVRSRFVRYLVPDQVRPYTVEVKSKLYESAMLVRHSSDPRSLIVLASHGIIEGAVDLLADYGNLKAVGREVAELYLALRDVVSGSLRSPALEDLIKEMRLPRELLGELERARRTGDPERFSRKLAIALSGESLYDTRDRLRAFVDRLRSLWQ